MPDKQDQITASIISKGLSILLSLPSLEPIADLWHVGRDAFRWILKDGIYEVLDYESTLELHNREGTRATFSKRKKIRYLQDNIIAYQDYAWGDGNILMNYRTSRGVPVDQYRSGFKTYILLSLREVRNRGDIDEYNIQWDIHQGFLINDGYWSTDVSQATKHIKVNIIFPKSRPPLRLLLEESNQHRNCVLGREVQQQLPDGRWLVSWETNSPRLYEVYVLRWTW